MSTRAAIARLTGVSPIHFAGRYHHWDGYPSGLGATLWQLYHGHFQGEIAPMLKVLLDDHPAGWSSLHASDFAQEPGFVDPLDLANHSTQQPQCYCHGDRNEEAWLVTEKNASGSGCEWAYVFTSARSTDGKRHDIMLVLSSYTSHGKMIGMFGMGDNKAIWPVVAAVDLNGTEPDWDNIESATPLDAMFPLGDLPGRKTGPNTPFICRDWGRRGMYQVRFPKDALHYVHIYTDAEGIQQVFCTCSAVEDAQSPDCAHSQVILAHLAEQKAKARERQERGLEYTASRIQAGDDPSQTMIWVWEAGQPRLLSLNPIHQLRSHSLTSCDTSFEWGHSGNGPAQLALAILLDFCGEEELALNHYQAFKTQFIASLNQDDLQWSIVGSDIAAFLTRNLVRHPTN